MWRLFAALHPAVWPALLLLFGFGSWSACCLITPSSSVFGFPALFAGRELASASLVAFCACLLFVQAIQADACGQRNGDSNRAQREAGFVAAVFLLGVLWLWRGSTASWSLQPRRIDFVVPSLWLPI
jgi:hypothetical protein